MRHSLSLGFALAATVTTTTPLYADEPIDVVASFSVLADMVEQVGGDHVSVTALVGPDSDPHMFSPSPTEARAVAQADLVVFNGLNYEGWMERLIDSSDYEGAMVTATDGITPLTFQGHGHDHHEHDDHGDHDHHEHDHDDHGHGDHDHGDHEHGHAGHHHEAGSPDPHAWQDLGNAVTYVANIRDGLIAADPAHADAYRANASRYSDAITALDDEIHTLLAEVPANSSVITGHEAFDYFANAYGISFLSPTGLSTSAEPSAADLARLIDVIRDEGVNALFNESMTSTATLEQLSEETGLPIAGTLYSGSLSAEGEASTYLGMMRHNAEVLHDALGVAGHQADPASGHQHQHDEDHDHDHDHDHEHDHDHAHEHEH
ncbi:zinc/manganese transport system substrate-binding protein [Onishia taeanensis]|uniref:Zinc/manganese transport system substrate-binding protein n=1 Tax=Onishia taeanensis TaxID=284577 RepID=A0A1G7UG53_9GAMM|nr:zinc ABC transporter substrate-binding protein [Halomonas taeanensis]SDG46473.1 zinc/manganese transport system substrate-binding protein [Halomonas taeanensis]